MENRQRAGHLHQQGGGRTRIPRIPGEAGEEVSDAEREAAAKMKIRNGLRLVLQGLEELWLLPRSFETKAEQGRR